MSNYRVRNNSQPRSEFYQIGKLSGFNLETISLTLSV